MNGPNNNDVSGFGSSVIGQAHGAGHQAVMTTASSQPEKTAINNLENNVAVVIENAEKMESAYIRTRHNNIRCFPECGKVHKTKSFCGTPLFIKLTRVDASKPWNLKDIQVFGEFRNVRKPPAFSVMSPCTSRMIEQNSFIVGHLSGTGDEIQYTINPPRKWRYRARIAQVLDMHVFTVYLVSQNVVVTVKDSPQFQVIPIWKADESILKPGDNEADGEVDEASGEEDEPFQNDTRKTIRSDDDVKPKKLVKRDSYTALPKQQDQADAGQMTAGANAADLAKLHQLQAHNIQLAAQLAFMNSQVSSSSAAAPQLFGNAMLNSYGVQNLSQNGGGAPWLSQQSVGPPLPKMPSGSSLHCFSSNIPGHYEQLSAAMGSLDGNSSLGGLMVNALKAQNHLSPTSTSASGTAGFSNALRSSATASSQNGGSAVEYLNSLSMPFKSNPSMLSPRANNTSNIQTGPLQMPAPLNINGSSTHMGLMLSQQQQQHQKQHQQSDPSSSSSSVSGITLVSSLPSSLVQLSDSMNNSNFNHSVPGTASLLATNSLSPPSTASNSNSTMHNLMLSSLLNNTFASNTPQPMAMSAPFSLQPSGGFPSEMFGQQYGQAASSMPLLQPMQQSQQQQPQAQEATGSVGGGATLNGAFASGLFGQTMHLTSGKNAKEKHQD